MRRVRLGAVCLERRFPGGALPGAVWRGRGPAWLCSRWARRVLRHPVDGLAEEIRPGFQVAAYQQRGIEPSTLEGRSPSSVRSPMRSRFSTRCRGNAPGSSGTPGAGTCCCASPLPPRSGWRWTGGRAARRGRGRRLDEFEAEMTRRIPEGDRELAQGLDERAMRGEGGPEDALESLRLAWPAYFASPDHAPRSTSPASRCPPTPACSTTSLAAARAALGVPRTRRSGCSARFPGRGARQRRAPCRPSDRPGGRRTRPYRGRRRDLVEGARPLPRGSRRPGCLRCGLRRTGRNRTRIAPDRGIALDVRQQPWRGPVLRARACGSSR